MGGMQGGRRDAGTAPDMETLSATFLDVDVQSKRVRKRVSKQFAAREQ